MQEEVDYRDRTKESRIMSAVMCILATTAFTFTGVALLMEHHTELGIAALSLTVPSVFGVGFFAGGACVHQDAEWINEDSESLITDQSGYAQNH